MRTTLEPPVALAPPTPSAPPPPATAPAPAGGLRKVSFGKIAKASDTKTAYPVLPDPSGQHAAIAARIHQRTDEVDALTSALDTDKAELKMLATPFWFQHLHGKPEIPSSLSVPSPAGEVLITFANRYKQLPDESSLFPILGERAGQFFRQAFELKISGDKIPAHVAPQLIEELQLLFHKYQAGDAVTVKDYIKPVDGFHEARHRELTIEQNLQLEQACPVIAMVKTKGRR